jgi:hypothetical protein
VLVLAGGTVCLRLPPSRLSLLNRTGRLLEAPHRSSAPLDGGHECCLLCQQRVLVFSALLKHVNRFVSLPACNSPCNPAAVSCEHRRLRCWVSVTIC